MPLLRFAPPPLDRPARLPLALAALLAVAAAFQLLAADPVGRDLPEPPPVGRPPRAFVPPPLPPAQGPAILARAMFAPVAGAAGQGSTAAAPADPLAGVAVAGMIQVGRASYAIVQQGARITRVPLGGRIAGFRLSALRQDGAVLTRGAERRVVPFGSGGATPPAGNNGEVQ
jgi:hypothetical protein